MPTTLAAMDPSSKFPLKKSNAETIGIDALAEPLGLQPCAYTCCQMAARRAGSLAVGRALLAAAGLALKENSRLKKSIDAARIRVKFYDTGRDELLIDPAKQPMCDKYFSVGL